MKETKGVDTLQEIKKRALELYPDCKTVGNGRINEIARNGYIKGRIEEQEKSRNN